MHLKILAPHDSLHSSLSFFLEKKTVSLYIACPFTQRVDVFASSVSHLRSLRETGILLREYEILQFINLWRDRILYLPGTALDCSQLVTNSCDIVMISDAPPRDDKKAFSTVGQTPEFHSFGIFDQEYNYSLQTFTSIDPSQLPKCKGNRTSLIYLPVGASLSSCFSILREMDQRLETLAPPPTDGRRVHCTLVLDEDSPNVDLRLLVPSNLEQIGILVMNPLQYFQWIADSEQKYTSLESSISIRELTHKSLKDFRFSPPPFMYQWRNFVFCTQTRLQGTYPQSDWASIVINSSAMDYLRGTISLETVRHLRRTLFFKGAGRFEYFAPLEHSIFKGPFGKQLHLIVYPCEVAHQYEKTLEKLLKDPEDQFMASMGFLRANGQAGTWSEKLFNIKIRKSGQFIYSDFIDDCFEGFALEAARQIISSSPPECCVCCTNSVNTLLEGCGHSFCNLCLTTMLDSVPAIDYRQGRQMADCPNCRTWFSKENLIQFKAYKTTRKKLKEDGVSRKKALQVILTDTQKGNHPKTLICGDLMEEVKSEENILFILPHSAVLNKVMQWFPGQHCACLDSDMDLIPNQKFSRILLITSFTDLSATALERLHSIIQSYTMEQFSLEILSLTYGTQYSFAEDLALRRSLEGYGEVKQTISGIII
jgi:hypothetical protein